MPIRFFFLIFIFSFCVWNNAFAYVFTKSASGKDIRWSTPQMNLFFNGNGDNNTFAGFASILQDSIDEWKEHSSVTINPAAGTGTDEVGQNDVFFSNDYFYGTGVLGVTEVSYRATDGVITEANIILNDEFNFSDDSSRKDFIGNVLTHELGHFLGIAHSEVAFSTMFYLLTKGQHTLDMDDAAAISVAYSSGVSRGSISGTVVGGSDATGVFGAHVHAISMKDGKVAASAVTDPDGTYTIGGLPLDDSYYIFIKPLEAISSLPLYYSSVKNNFCAGGYSYRASFYQGCLSSDQGLPVAVRLSSSSSTVEIDPITIQCDLNTPTNYLSTRTMNFSSQYSDAYVGAFSQASIDAGTEDTIEIDLRHIDPIANDYVNIKVQTQGLFSKLNLGVYVVDGAGTVNDDYGNAPGVDADGNPVVDRVIRIPLSSTPSENIFTVTLSTSDANKLDLSGTDEDLDGIYDEVYPGYSGSTNPFLDSIQFYMFSFSVLRSSDNLNFSESYYDLDNEESNLSCLEAPQTYRVAASVSAVESEDTTSNSGGSSGGCGSIAFDGSSGTGGSGSNKSIPLTIMLGMLFGYSSMRLRKKEEVPVKIRK